MKRKRKSIFNLTYNEAMSKLNAIAKKLSNENQASITLTDDLDFNQGITYDGINDEPHAIVGKRNLSQRTHILPSKCAVPDANFITCSICIFHENWHLSNTINHYEIYKEYPEIHEALISEHIAKQENPQYYIQHINQYLTEIYAEYNGIKDAYDYITDIFPNVNKSDIDNLFITHINDLKNNSTYKLDRTMPDLQSMSDLDSAFDAAVDQYFTRNDWTYFYNRSNNRDELATVLRNPKWDKITTKFCAEKHAPQRDKMTASISVHLHPEYLDEWTELQQINLSAQTIFHCDFPADDAKSSSAKSIAKRRGEQAESVLHASISNDIDEISKK